MGNKDRRPLCWINSPFWTKKSSLSLKKKCFVFIYFQKNSRMPRILFFGYQITELAENGFRCSSLYVYIVPLRDVVGLKSRGCRKWKGGASSSGVPIYPEEYCCKPYYKMRFDDVLFILNLFAEMWSWSHVSTVSSGEHLNGRRLKYVSSRGFTVLFPGHVRLKVRQWRVPFSRIRA